MRWTAAGLVLLFMVGLLPSQTEQSRTLPPRPKAWRDSETRYQLEGWVGRYLKQVSTNWLKIVPEANPAILDMFRDRNRQPLRKMEPWAGEFAGKYLTAAVQVYRLTRDAELKLIIQKFVDDLVQLQAADGYLGPWPTGSQLTGNAPNAGAKGGPTWDAWGHYHIMLGLLLWYDETRDPKALACARRMADRLCDQFLGDKKTRLVDTGSTEMNLAPVDSLCMLYRATRFPRYLFLARQLVNEFGAKDSAGKPLAGDYLEAALAGKEFYQSPKPRWESLHPILGLIRLYYLNGGPPYRDAFEHWWWSIVKLDRHNNGGFSSGEQAQGNPYHQGAIETCCTIAWLAMSVEMLHHTGNSLVADELELSTLNSVIGMHSPSGRWCTYNTPMDGVRKASAHDIVFQAREGSPELNCCSVNGARGFGLISEWAVMQNETGLMLNWYGPGVMETRLQGDTKVRLTQQTHYPAENKVRLRVDPAAEREFTLQLRIPSWSAKTQVQVNGIMEAGVVPGKYLALRRKWKEGDVVDLTFDFTPHFWVGERECYGRTSLYRGPILLTYDRRLNELDPGQLPVLDASSLLWKESPIASGFQPLVCLQLSDATGKSIRVCDFGSAGHGGSPYVSWLKIDGVQPAGWSRDNPLRSSRILKAR